MNGVMDTLVWIANFPATHGYAFVFIAAFGAFGLLANAIGSGGRRKASYLQQVREARGMAAAEEPSQGPDVLGGLSRWFFRILGIVVLGCGLIGLISMIGKPITAAYIYEHGVSVEAKALDWDYVQYTAEDGETYTMRVNFFTTQSYPGNASLAIAVEPVVRYLPGHPQAFVVDTDASLDVNGDPVGD